MENHSQSIIARFGQRGGLNRFLRRKSNTQAKRQRIRFVRVGYINNVVQCRE